MARNVKENIFSVKVSGYFIFPVLLFPFAFVVPSDPAILSFASHQDAS